MGYPCGPSSEDDELLAGVWAGWVGWGEGIIDHITVVTVEAAMRRASVS
jgi:hypothetical protein